MQNTHTNYLPTSLVKRLSFVLFLGAIPIAYAAEQKLDVTQALKSLGKDRKTANNAPKKTQALHKLPVRKPSSKPQQCIH
ncbi:MAG: hypothetical protein AAF380_01130 [Bacteroidota bacterium]